MTSSDEKAVAIAPPAAWFGIRHLQTLLMAGSSFLIYMLRVNLSVAIVGMTDSAPANGTEGAPLHELYDWDEETKGYVLSSFFWGYALTQVPVGVLSQRLGGHRFLVGALLSTSIMAILLPPCAYIGGWQLVCFNRMLQGMTQGAVYPSIFTMMGLWTPAPERSTLSGIILGAQTMGPVVATPLAGLLVAKCGWPSVFYSYGAYGALYSLVVWRLCSDRPANHRHIAAEEQAYIEATIGGHTDKAAPTPWRHLLRSGPAWAAILTMALQGGVFLAFLTKMPSYLSDVLKFEIKENGLLTALPYFVSWSLSFPFSTSCDWLVRRGYLTLTQARKVYNSISHVVGGLAILGLGFCTDTVLSVVLLTVSIGVMSASYPGVQANFMDLTPNYSGTIFSISNFLSAIAGVFAPLVISSIVTEKGSVSQWRTVYCLLAGVMFVSNLLFVACASGEVQPWNSPRSLRRDSEEGDDATGQKLSRVS